MWVALFQVREMPGYDCACYVNGRGGFFRRREEVTRVLPSKMRDFILIKALPKSETGFVI